MNVELSKLEIEVILSSLPPFWTPEGDHPEMSNLKRKLTKALK